MLCFVATQPQIGGNKRVANCEPTDLSANTNLQSLTQFKTQFLHLVNFNVCPVSSQYPGSNNVRILLTELENTKE